MANRKSPSEIARRENWKAIYAGAKRRGTERSSLPEDVPHKAEAPPQKNTDVRSPVMHGGITRNAKEKPCRSRNIAVPESTEKDIPAPHMDTVRRVLRKMEYPSTDELGNRSPVIPKVTKSNPQPFQPVMSWPLPNGNGDCAVARNGNVAVRYRNGEFAPIGSIRREVKENEKKKNVAADVKKVYLDYESKRENERKR
jgi:hypothetical protein